VKKVIGEKVAIDFKSYNVHAVRDAIKALKKGDETLTLAFGPIKEEPSPDDFIAYAATGLKDLTLKGAAGQAYWTVGSTFDNDILLPKLSFALGGHFAIKKVGGQYAVKDLSQHHYET